MDANAAADSQGHSEWRIMSLKSRLDQLQWKAAKKSQRGVTRAFAAEEAERWKMTERIFELTPEDMREAFVAALTEREGPGVFNQTRQSPELLDMRPWIRPDDSAGRLGTGDNEETTSHLPGRHSARNHW